MMPNRKFLIVALIVVLAAVSIGLGYAAEYKGSVNSENNFNEVGVYALHIYDGDSEVLAPLQLDRPDFKEGVSQNGHKCVIIEDNVISTIQYTLLTDETDAGKGAHIRMWMFFDNAMMWAFIDKIELTVWEGEGDRITYTCGKSGSTSGVCTNVIELTPGVLEHEFIITVTYKQVVEIDYYNLEDAIKESKIRAVFVYDDVDPILGDNDEPH